MISGDTKFPAAARLTSPGWQNPSCAGSPGRNSPHSGLVPESRLPHWWQITRENSVSSTLSNTSLVNLSLFSDCFSCFSSASDKLMMISCRTFGSPVVTTTWSPSSPPLLHRGEVQRHALMLPSSRLTWKSPDHLTNLPSEDHWNS